MFTSTTNVILFTVKRNNNSTLDKKWRQVQGSRRLQGPWAVCNFISGLRLYIFKPDKRGKYRAFPLIFCHFYNYNRINWVIKRNIIKNRPRKSKHVKKIKIIIKNKYNNLLKLIIYAKNKVLCFSMFSITLREEVIVWNLLILQ